VGAGVRRHGAGLLQPPARTASSWSTGGRSRSGRGGKDGLKTPVGVAVGPDGRLYAANLHGNTVGVWAGDAPPAGPAQVIGGEAMRGPISVAFTRPAVRTAAQVGNFEPRPSNTGKDWTPDGTAVYNLLADKSSAALPAFGLDTEGGDRAKTNLLREPIRLVFTLADGTAGRFRQTPGGRGDHGGPGRLPDVAGRRAYERLGGPARGPEPGDGPSRSRGRASRRSPRRNLLLAVRPAGDGDDRAGRGVGRPGGGRRPPDRQAPRYGQLRRSGRRPGRAGSTSTFTLRSRQQPNIDLRVVVLGGAGPRALCRRSPRPAAQAAGRHPRRRVGAGAARA
jgi:hypothetical protein